jgi:tetratricopeptide (TPR) repeat protein
VSTDSPGEVEGYLRRAELLAELGRYGEAVTELGFALALAPSEVRLRELLARVHLAAEQPEKALTVIDDLLAEAPDYVPALVLRGHALLDLQQYAEAADLADRILAVAPFDPYALRNGAAILSGARNGQPALDAAWRGVALAPEEAQAHLVLALVAARLRLSLLAERAYREALARDPGLPVATTRGGVARWERARYAAALADLMAVEVETDPVEETEWVSIAAVGSLITYGAVASLIGILTVAVLIFAGDLVSRLATIGVVIIVGLIMKSVAERSNVPMPRVIGMLLTVPEQRLFGYAICAVLASLVLLLGYGLTGLPWALAAAIVAALAGELVVITRVR